MSIISNERNIFKLLKNNLNLSEKSIDEILKGAFVVVKHDKGKLYNTLKNSKLKPYHRSSSHPSLSENNGPTVIIKDKCIGKSQMAIDSNYLRTFLFGKIRCHEDIKNKGDPQMHFKKLNNKVTIYRPPKHFKICTWFQFESSRWESPNQTLYDTITHFYDFISYFFKGENQGPLGNSNYTGRPSKWNPLVIDFNNAKNNAVQYSSPDHVSYCNTQRILVK